MRGSKRNDNDVSSLCDILTIISILYLKACPVFTRFFCTINTYKFDCVDDGEKRNKALLAMSSYGIFMPCHAAWQRISKLNQISGDNNCVWGMFIDKISNALDDVSLYMANMGRGAKMHHRLPPF